MFALAHYVILYNKERWDSFIIEFQNETEQNRKRGTIAVLAYLIGSIILFFALLPIVFGF
jgi:hypothetical protein